MKEKQMATQKASSKIEVPQSPPEGFQKGGRPDIHGWYKIDIGSIVHGKIVGHMVTKGKNGDRDVILVELESPCIAYEKGDKEGKVLEPGKILGVTVSFDIRECLDYVNHRGMIWLKPIEKKKLDGGNTVWRFEQHYKGKKSPLVRSSSALGSAGDDDDIPF